MFQNHDILAHTSMESFSKNRFITEPQGYHHFVDINFRFCEKLPSKMKALALLNPQVGILPLAHKPLFGPFQKMPTRIDPKFDGDIATIRLHNLVSK